MFADEFKTELSNIHQFSAGNPDSGRLLHSGRIHVGAVMGAPRRSTTTCRRRRWWWGRVTLSRSCSWFLPFWMSLQSSVGHWIQHQSHLLFSLLSLQKTHFSWKRREVASFWKTPACGGRICENPAKRSCWVNLGLNGLSSICKLTLKKSKQRNS